MGNYKNKTIIKGTEDAIENLVNNLISRVGFEVTLERYKNNPYYTEVIELKDYEVYGDTDSEDTVLELNFAALDFPVVRFWENEEFKITKDGIHSIFVESYNANSQIYVSNLRTGNTDQDVESIVYMPRHSFLNVDDVKKYFAAITKFVSEPRLEKLIDKICAGNKQVKEEVHSYLEENLFY